MNWVYGCVYVMCLSEGFGSEDIFLSRVIVQSGFGGCIRRWLHAIIEGLIVVMSAYNSSGGGWCWYCEMYLIRYGYVFLASSWDGCVVFRLGENCVAKC